MQIHIKTLTGRRININLEDSDKIVQIKNLLQEKEGIERAQIRLIFGGKQLKDNNSLKYYNLKPGSILHMVLQLRGG